jgi:hypothetical protein
MSKGFGQPHNQKPELDFLIRGLAEATADILKESNYQPSQEELEAAHRVRSFQGSRRDIILTIRMNEAIGIIKPLSREHRMQLIDTLIYAQQHTTERDRFQAQRFAREVEAHLQALMRGADS